jgi:hypothetical protein
MMVLISCCAFFRKSLGLPGEKFQFKIKAILDTDLLSSLSLSVNSFPVNAGQSKFDWFKQFLELPHGIPSHDTLGRRFARIDTNESQNLFILYPAFKIKGATHFIDQA